VLITEGTMLSRMTEKIYSEVDMLRDCKRLLEQHRYVFLICSSTNVDTLATFYQAAKSHYMKMYASSYVCEQIGHYKLQKSIMVRMIFVMCMSIIRIK